MNCFSEYYLLQSTLPSSLLSQLLSPLCPFSCSATALQWATASSFMRFLDHAKRRFTVCRTPLDEWSAPRTDHYLTKHNTHNKHTSKSSAGFEPTVSAGELPETQANALDSAATGTGTWHSIYLLSQSFTSLPSPRVDCNGRQFNTTLLRKVIIFN